MTTVFLPDGKITTFFNNDQIVCFVRESLGKDMADMFVELLRNEAYETARTESDCDSYEASLEANTQCFQDLLYQIGLLVEMLDKPRLWRPDVAHVLSDMRNAINNQI